MHFFYIIVESICDPKWPNPQKIPSKGFIVLSDSSGDDEFQKKVFINRTPERGLICIFSKWQSVKLSTHYYVFMVGFTRYKCISNIYENKVSESNDHIFIHL